MQIPFFHSLGSAAHCPHCPHCLGKRRTRRTKKKRRTEGLCSRAVAYLWIGLLVRLDTRSLWGPFHILLLQDHVLWKTCTLHNSCITVRSRPRRWDLKSRCSILGVSKGLDPATFRRFCETKPGQWEPQLWDATLEEKKSKKEKKENKEQREQREREEEEKRRWNCYIMLYIYNVII